MNEAQRLEITNTAKKLAELLKPLGLNDTNDCHLIEIFLMEQEVQVEVSEFGISVRNPK